MVIRVLLESILERIVLAKCRREVELIFFRVLLRKEVGRGE